MKKLNRLLTKERVPITLQIKDHFRGDKIMQPHFSGDPSDDIRKTHFIAWYVRWKLLKTNPSSSYFKLLFFNATMDAVFGQQDGFISFFLQK